MKSDYAFKNHLIFPLCVLCDNRVVVAGVGDGGIDTVLEQHLISSGNCTCFLMIPFELLRLEWAFCGGLLSFNSSVEPFSIRFSSGIKVQFVWGHMTGLTCARVCRIFLS